jgi:hypothetical protein
MLANASTRIAEMIFMFILFLLLPFIRRRRRWVAEMFVGQLNCPTNERRIAKRKPSLVGRG